MTTVLNDEFHWYISSQRTALFPNADTGSFCADLPEIVRSDNAELKVALCQFCLPAGLINVNAECRVIMKISGEPSETVQFVTTPNCYKTLQQIVESLNESINRTAFANKVLISDASEFCKIAVEEASSITVELSAGLATMLGFSPGSFPCKNLTASATFNPMALRPYVLLCSETLLETVGDSAVKPILKILPLRENNLSQSQVYDFWDKLYIPRTDGTSRLCISFKGPNFEDLTMVQPLCDNNAFALLSFIKMAGD